MLRISKPIRNNVATLLFASATILAGANTAKQLNEDYKKFEADTTLSETNKTNLDPASDEAKASAVLFSVGLLGTGLALNRKRKYDRYEASLNKVFNNMDLKIKFESPKSIKLLDANGYSISNSSYSLEGYTWLKIFQKKS